MTALDLLIASSDGTFQRRLAHSLRREPDFRWIHEAKDRAEVEQALVKLTLPVILLDFPMAGFDRLESLHTIRLLSPGTRTILLVDAPDDSEAVRALRAGVRGYGARQTGPALLLKAIQLVWQGEIWIGRKIIVQLLEDLAARPGPGAVKADERFGLLTQRECQIISLIATGASNKEIASRLSITERTVKAHLTHIFQKLGLSTRLHLAVYALQAKPPGAEASSWLTPQGSRGGPARVAME